MIDKSFKIRFYLRVSPKQHGMKYASVHREESNPNDVIAVHQFKDIKRAKYFSNAVPLLMEKIGVIGSPEIWFSEDVEQVTYS